MALASRRVLVVNDDARMARSVCALLTDAGYDTRVAFDGDEGVAVLSSWPADLVVLDLTMPRLDGLGFLAELQRSPGLKQPLVLVWSVAGQDELERARARGAAECLSRSSTGPQTLLDVIDRLLGGATANPGGK